MDDIYKYLLVAFEEAELAKQEGTFPIGAVLVDNTTGLIIARERNRVFSSCDTTGHAEVNLLRAASDRLIDLSTKQFINNDYTIYSTCEPCPMCTCTILLSGIKKVVWAANDNTFGAARKFKEGPHFSEYFDTISYLATPYPELELKQRSMIADFYTSRGYVDTEWHKELS
ncbi:nucleoside deaminase [Paenibacillus fonticola]|uniref:nucleoside deaminase n=1 Tax=Paenibacillus fonticola TaxID=379896 RepID=UPI000373AC94|nr:nucleoside deaminase [Paenibacillus fonticola]